MRLTPLLHAVILVAVLVSLGMQPGQATPPPASAAPGSAVVRDIAATELPDSPAGRQASWVLDQLNGGAVDLDEATLTDRFTPAFLAALPPAPLLQLLRQSALEHRPIRVTGVAKPTTDTALIVLAETRAGEPVAIYLNVEPRPPHRITALEVSEPPGPPASAVAVPGPFTGAFDIGGRYMFLTCAGEGTPTVVLEAGAGGGAAVWADVQPALVHVTRVCSYDRANVPGGASDPAPKPRSAAEVVADLHALLTVAGIPGPYVLAGHSLGGLYARLYASTYPGAVVGLVLVDATHEDQEGRRAALLQPLLPTPPLATELGDAPFVERVGDEQVDFERSAAQVRAARAAASLPSMPFVVLAHGLAPEPEPGMPAELTEAQEQLWRELQADLAGLVPGGRLVIAARSGHGIQQDQPELVIEAIRAVVDVVRRAPLPAAPGK
jgi:pimeloyl-ACP methyl ester carboxylesterase